MNIVTVKSKGQITLPQSIRKFLGIRVGDVVGVAVEGSRIILSPQVLIDREQAWFWTPEWQAAERQASEDIKAGRVFHFQTAEGATAALDE